MGLVARTLDEVGVEPLMTRATENAHRRTVDAAVAPADGKVPSLPEALALLQKVVFVATDVFDRLIELLSDAKAKFRIIEHQAEGRSEAISEIRGNRPEQAAKAMVLDLRGGGGGKRHVLAVLPGSRKLDFGAVAALFDARKCGFASPQTAQELTGCVMGSVPPFSLSPALALVVEQDLLDNDTLFFNAGRLDRSMELDTKDWLAVAKPKVAQVSPPERWCFAPLSEADFEPLLVLRIDVMREHLECVFRYKQAAHGYKQAARGASSVSISRSPACA